MPRIALPLCLLLLFASASTAETLEDAWHTATRVNNRLRAQGHQVAAAQAEHQAAKAERFPKVSNRSAYIALSEQPSFSIGLPDLSGIGLPLPSSVDLPLADRQFAMSATTVTVPLYTGGKITAGIDATRHQVRAVHAGYAASQQEIRLEVAEAYFNVLRTRQLWEVTQSAEKTLFEHQKNVEKLLEQKIVTRNALLAAQTAWAAAAQESLKAENLVIVAEAAYNRYVGRALDYPVLIEPASIEEWPIPDLSGDLDALTSEALRCRKELVQVASQSKASASLSKVAQADRLPQVVAMGAHSYIQNSHLSEESYWAGGVGLQWTPIDGGTSRARERAALQNAAAAARMRDETRSLIALEVRAAWVKERETRSRIDVAELGKQQADENLRVVTRQFQEGLINHTEVLDAQTQQTAAAMNLCNARYDAITATYRLRRAVGWLY